MVHSEEEKTGPPPLHSSSLESEEQEEQQEEQTVGRFPAEVNATGQGSIAWKPNLTPERKQRGRKRKKDVKLSDVCWLQK